MVSWDERLFAASGSHEQLFLFCSISIINKKFINMNYHTLEIMQTLLQFPHIFCLCISRQATWGQTQEGINC